MKRYISIGLALAVAAQGFFIFLIHQQMRGLQAQYRDHSSRLAALSPRVSGLELRLPALTGAPHQLAAANETTKDTFPTTTAPATESAVPQNMMQAQTEMAVATAYSDVLGDLSISSDLKEQLVSLLGKKLAALSQMAMQVSNPGLSPQDRKALTVQMGDSLRKTDAAIAALFSNDPEGLATLQSYEASQPERMLIQQLKASLQDPSLQLTETQEQALMNTMFAARKQFPFAHDFTSHLKLYNISDITKPNVERFLQQHAALDATIANETVTILRPEQQEAFLRTQEHEASYRVSNLNSLARMFDKNQ